MPRLTFLSSLVLALLVSASAARAADEAPGAAEAKRVEAQEKRVLLSVTSPTFQVDGQMIRMLLDHLAADRCAAELAGWSVEFIPLPGGAPGQTLGFLEVMHPGYSGGKIGESEKTLGVQAATPHEGPSVARADEVVKVVREGLQEVLREAARDGAKSADEKRERAELSRRCAIHEAGSVRDGLRELRESMARAGVSPGASDRLLESLRARKLELSVEREGLAARREAVIERIAWVKKENMEKREERLKNDPVTEKLKAILDVRRREHARLGEINARTPGTISAADMDLAQSLVATAKAELDEHRRQLERETGEDALSEWNRELARIEIDLRAAEPRLAVLEKELARLTSPDVQGLLAQHGEVVTRVKQAEAVEAAAQESVRLDFSSESVTPPRVEIINPDFSPKKKAKNKRP